MIETGEIWMPIPGFGDAYEASNLGRIKSKARMVIKIRNGDRMEQFYKERMLAQFPVDKCGHLAVTVSHNDTYKPMKVHSLVLMAFIGSCPDGMEACHINGISNDNRPENLRWDTHLNNNRDRIKHGTIPCGETHKLSKFTEKQVIDIRSGKITRKQALNELGMSSSQHQRIKNGLSWKHLTGQEYKENKKGKNL